MTSETAPILIAVGDALLHPEATHLAAATGRPIIDSQGPGDLVRHYPRAFAVLIDAACAPDLAPLPRRDGVFLVRSEASLGMSEEMSEGTSEETSKSVSKATGGLPAPSAGEAAGMVEGVADAFVLPAQAAELLKALGRLALAAGPDQRQQRFASASGHRRAEPARRGSDTFAAVGTVLSFVGATGGAGTSTLAAAVARAASPDTHPVVVDAHRYSGGLDLLFGVEEEVGARWGDIDIGEGRVDRAQLRQALPRTSDGIAVLTGARTTVVAVAGRPGGLPADVDRVTTVLGAGGLTVVDAPPDALPNRCDHAFIVVPAEVRAAAAAALISAECRAANTPVSLVLRHRGWSGLSAEEVERVAGADVVAEVKHLPRLVRETEVAGLPKRLPRPLVTAAEAVLEAANG